MIKRSYFFRAVGSRNTPVDGVVTHKSWFPQQGVVHRLIVENSKSELESTAVTIVTLNRI